MGLTLDTGALIALERRHHRMAKVFASAARARIRITVPSAVVVEWWRGRTGVREELLLAVDVEPLDEALSRVAGEALANVRGATAIDAVVMASAARRGDVVYTSDFADLSRLQRHFPTVRLLSA